MKRVTLLLTVLLTASIGFAQMPGGQMNFKPEDMAKRQVDRLQESLKLEKAQYDSIYVFFLAQAKEQQKQREQMGQGGGQQMDREAMMERFQKQRELQEAKLKSILTEEQFKKYQEQQAQQRAGGFGGGQGQGPRQGQGQRQGQRQGQNR